MLLSYVPFHRSDYAIANNFYSNYFGKLRGVRPTLPESRENSCLPILAHIVKSAPLDGIKRSNLLTTLSLESERWWTEFPIHQKGKTWGGRGKTDLYGFYFAAPQWQVPGPRRGVVVEQELLSKRHRPNVESHCFGHDKALEFFGHSWRPRSRKFLSLFYCKR